MISTAWLQDVVPSTSSDSTMKEQKQKTDMGLVTHTLKRCFWPAVAVINGLLFIDFVFFGAKGFIWLLFFLTGGYSG